MKRPIPIAVFFLSTLSLFAQGTVVLNNNVPGVVVTHVYIGPWGAPLKVGNGPNDTPPGGQDYSQDIPLEGSGWSAQLWAAPGTEPNDLMLLAAPSITTFRTGAEAGSVEPLIATLEGVPADAAVASIQLRVWDNGGGSVTSWSHADRRGKSPIFAVYNIGGVMNPPPYLTNLQSFSLAWGTPSTEAPEVVWTDPPTGATGVSRAAPVIFAFSKAMKTNSTYAVLRDITIPNPLPPFTPPVVVRSNWSAGNTVLTCTPVQPFLANRLIYWELQGRSQDGYALPTPAAGSFTTGNAPVLMNPAVPEAGFSFDVLSSTGQVLTVQYRTSLLSGSWQTLLNTNSPGDVVHITDSRPLSSPGMFYRVTSP